MTLAGTGRDDWPSMRQSRQIKIYDTTLRDGTQGEGVAFSMEDKVRIAQRLDALGIHYIEGGWPGSNPKDLRFFRRMQDVTLKHAQEALGGPIYWRTPSDYPTVVSSINSGQPVVTAAPRSKVARNLRDLAGGLYRPASPSRPGLARSPSFMRMMWNPKGIPGDG